MLGGFITPADSSSTSLGIGLSIALKAEGGIPDWLWGAVAQWSEHLQLKKEALGSIPSGCPGFFLFQLAYTQWRSQGRARPGMAHPTSKD